MLVVFAGVYVSLSLSLAGAVVFCCCVFFPAGAQPDNALRNEAHKLDSVAPILNDVPMSRWRIFSVRRDCPSSGKCNSNPTCTMFTRFTEAVAIDAQFEVAVKNGDRLK